MLTEPQPKQGERPSGEEQVEMEAKREQVFVGFFVLVAAALLIFTVFALTGAFAGLREDLSTPNSTTPRGWSLAPPFTMPAARRSAASKKCKSIPVIPSLIDMTLQREKRSSREDRQPAWPS